MTRSSAVEKFLISAAFVAAAAMAVIGDERAPTPPRPRAGEDEAAPPPGRVSVKARPAKPEAEPSDDAPKDSPLLSLEAQIDLSKARQALMMKTMGGKQFWGDVYYFQNWRVQRNVFTGHYRLLDGDDYRHTWGTREECLQKLEEIKKERKLPPMKGKAVVVIHGIVRSSKSFAEMRTALERDGYAVFGFDYPSTQVPIPESAEYLDSCLKSLEGIEEIDFVVHSMGGLVVRSYLASHSDERIKRMVMLGVPNNGAEMADLVKTNPLFKAVYGPAGQQLVTGKDSLIAKLPVPEFEFAILSGARGTPDGFNPLIAGDDDGTVCLESTRLPGACDFGTVKCLHSFLMKDPAVIDQTVRFLKDGRLREKGERTPIPKTKDEEKVEEKEPVRS